MGCSNSNVRENEKEKAKEKESKPVSENKDTSAQKTQIKSGEVPKVKGAEKFYSGVLADNATFHGQILFTNQDQLEDFKRSIATQVVHLMDNGDGGKPNNVKYVKNDTDPFLNGEAKIDFSRQRLIVCRGSCLSTIEEKYGRIVVTFGRATMVRENYYYAYVINSVLNDWLDEGINYEEEYDNNVIIDQRPINNNVIIEQRPINNNVIIEQRVINNNVIIEQRPINNNEDLEHKPNVVEEEFSEPPDEYADGNKEKYNNNEYENEEYAEGENNDYEEA